MADFEPTGVRLVVQDHELFLRTLGRANTGVANFSRSAQGAARGPLQVFSAILSRIGTIAAGIVAARIFSRIADALRNQASAALAAASAFQTLTVRFETFAAREIAAERGLTDLSDALEAAKEPAQDLLLFIEGLAVTAPFRLEDIANTVAFSRAMGFATETSKSLTVSIGEFVAGMGLGSEEIKRIIFNFGQMRFQGKVTSTELRDLARGSLLPVNDIMNEMARIMNVSTEDMEDFRKAIADGSVDVDLFFKAFQNIVERDFSGSMERLGRTAEGLRARLVNLFKVVFGAEILGPVLDRVTNAFADWLDQITGILPVNEELNERIDRMGGTVQQTGSDVNRTNQLLDNARFIGIALGDVFDNIVKVFTLVRQSFRAFANAMGFSLPTVREVAAGIAALVEIGTELVQRALPGIVRFAIQTAETLGSLAEEAFEWGAKIVEFLAEGIIRATGTVLVSALNFIGTILREWLAPSSPPQIAPELDVWGADTFTEWLRGFARADFGVLRAVQGPLRSALSTLADLELISQETANQLFIGLTEDMIRAVNQFRRTGEISANILRELSSIGGNFGRQLVELFRREVRLASAIEDVADAQEALNEAIDQTERARGTVQNLIDEYNELLRAGADDAILDARLAEINAAEDQFSLAREQEAAAEDALAAAEAQIDPLREQAEIQEELIRQLLELARAQADLAGAGGAGDGGGFDPVPIEFDPAGVANLGDTISEGLDELFENMKNTIKNRIQELLQDLVTQVENSEIVKTWRVTVGLIKLQWQLFVIDLKRSYREGILPVFDALGIDLQNIATEVEETTSTWEDHWLNKVLSSINDVYNFIENFLLKSLGGLLDIVAAIAEKVLDLFVGSFLLGQFLRDTFAGIIKDLLERAGGLIDFEGIMNGLAIGFRLVKERLEELPQLLHDLADAIREFEFKDLIPFLPGSLPPLAEGFRLVREEMERFQQAAQVGAIGRVAAPSTVSNVNNVGFGDVYLNNGMDVGQLEALVRRVIRKG